MIVVLKRTFCRMLMVLVACAPCQFAQAGMIGTDRIVSSTSTAERSAVLNFLGRADVAQQLQTLGVDPATAKDRVAAMTDEEVRYLAGRIDAMPAGGNTLGLIFLIVILAIIVWIWQR
jgi:uncharacterized protein DUF6627